MRPDPSHPPIAVERIPPTAAFLFLLVAITAVAPLSLNILMPALPGIARTLQSPIEVVQLTLSLYMIVLAVSQIVNGALSDRYGRRPVLIVGLALTVLASIAAAMATDITMLIAARSLQAIGASAGIVLSRAIIRDLYDRERAASMIGWVTMAIMIVPMVVPWLGGVIETSLGWPTIFTCIAGFTGLILVWVCLALPETWRAPLSTADPIRYRDELAMLFASRKFIGYIVCCATGSAMFFVMLGGAPHVVVTQMGRSPAELGLWLITGATGYMIGNYCSANYSQRIGVDRMILWGSIMICVSSTITLLWVWATPNGGPMMLFVPQILTAMGNGMLVPNAIAGAISVRPQAAGTASGITGFLQMAIGGAGAQLIAHMLAGAHSAMPLVVVIAVCAGLCLVSYMLLVRQRPAKL